MFGRSRIETKTPDQILRMRKAGLVVGQTLQLMAQTVRPGMTTKQLDELAEEHIRGCGATPSFLGYHGFTGSLCTSVNDEVVHGIPGSRVLAEGDLISIDCGAIVDGWHGDAAISVIVGGRDAGRPEDLALIDATEDSMWAGIAALTVGESLYAVGAGVEDSIVASGERDGHDYGIIEDYVGHGIGTEMHMDPQVPNYRVRDRGPHSRFVHLIRTRMRDRHHDERQTSGGRLRLEHITAHGMHRHSIDGLIHRRQQRLHRAGILNIQHVQCPRAVLARAPRQENLHLNASG